MEKGIKKLVEKNHEFCKLAGILRVPPQLLKNISEWAIGCYCFSVVGKLNHLLASYPEHPQRSNWLMIRGIAKNKLDKQEITAFSKQFELSMEDLPYQETILPQMFWKNKSRRWLVNVYFISNTEKNHTIYNLEAWSGLWSPTKNIEKSIILGDLYIARDVRHDVKKMIKENNPIFLHEAWKSITEIVRHEMQHLMQELLKYLLDLKEIGGLPGKTIREKERDASGYLYQVEHGKTQNTVGDPHELRDMEFYTRLSDDIDEFNYFKKYVPVELQQDFLKAWVGEINKETFKSIIYSKKQMEELAKKWHEGNKGANNQLTAFDIAFQAIGHRNLFFLFLKRFSPMKWKKAVKEFVKAVSG